MYFQRWIQNSFSDSRSHVQFSNIHVKIIIYVISKVTTFWLLFLGENSIISVWSHWLHYDHHYEISPYQSKRFQVRKRSNEGKFYKLCILVTQNCDARKKNGKRNWIQRWKCSKITSFWTQHFCGCCVVLQHYRWLLYEGMKLWQNRIYEFAGMSPLHLKTSKQGSDLFDELENMDANIKHKIRSRSVSASSPQ